MSLVNDNPSLCMASLNIMQASGGRVAPEKGFILLPAGHTRLDG